MVETQLQVSDEITILSFQIGKIKFGIEIHDIINIKHINLEKLYIIPKSSNEVLGMYNYGNEVIPIFDLHQLLNNFEYGFDAIKNKSIAIIKIKVKSFTSGLGLQDEPTFETFQKSQIQASKAPIIKSILQSEDEEEISIIDLNKLFPNVKTLVETKSPGNEEDDLDLSQYLLKE